MAAFATRFKALSDYKPDHLLVLAGVEGLGKYGNFATLVNITGGDVLKFDAVMERPAEEIYVLLCYQMDSGIVQKEYSRLMSLPNK
jgi:hypothetical protein